MHVTCTTVTESTNNSRGMQTCFLIADLWSSVDNSGVEGLILRFYLTHATNTFYKMLSFTKAPCNGNRGRAFWLRTRGISWNGMISESCYLSKYLTLFSRRRINKRISTTKFCLDLCLHSFWLLHRITYFSFFDAYNYFFYQDKCKYFLL